MSEGLRVHFLFPVTESSTYVILHATDYSLEEFLLPKLAESVSTYYIEMGRSVLPADYFWLLLWCIAQHWVRRCSNLANGLGIEHSHNKLHANVLKQESICPEGLNSCMCKPGASIYASEHLARSETTTGKHQFIPSTISTATMKAPLWEPGQSSRSTYSQKLQRTKDDRKSRPKRRQMYIRKPQKRAAWNPTNHFFFCAIGKVREASIHT